MASGDNKQEEFKNKWDEKLTNIISMSDRELKEMVLEASYLGTKNQCGLRNMKDQTRYSMLVDKMGLDANYDIKGVYANLAASYASIGNLKIAGYMKKSTLGLRDEGIARKVLEDVKNNLDEQDCERLVKAAEDYFKENSILKEPEYTKEKSEKFKMPVAEKDLRAFSAITYAMIIKSYRDGAVGVSDIRNIHPIIIDNLKELDTKYTGGQLIKEINKREAEYVAHDVIEGVADINELKAFTEKATSGKWQKLKEEWKNQLMGEISSEDLREKVTELSYLMTKNQGKKFNQIDANRCDVLTKQLGLEKDYRTKGVIAKVAMGYAFIFNLRMAKAAQNFGASARDYRAARKVEKKVEQEFGKVAGETERSFGNEELYHTLKKVAASFTDKDSPLKKRGFLKENLAQEEWQACCALTYAEIAKKYRSGEVGVTDIAKFDPEIRAEIERLDIEHTDGRVMKEIWRRESEYKANHLLSEEPEQSQDPQEEFEKEEEKEDIEKDKENKGEEIKGINGWQDFLKEEPENKESELGNAVDRELAKADVNEYLRWVHKGGELNLKYPQRNKDNHQHER